MFYLPSTHTHIRQYSNIIIYRHYDIKSGRGHLYFLYGLFSLFMVEEFWKLVSLRRKTRHTVLRLESRMSSRTWIRWSILWYQVRVLFDCIEIYMSVPHKSILVHFLRMHFGTKKQKD